MVNGRFSSTFYGHDGELIKQNKLFSTYLSISTDTQDEV